VSTTTPSIIVQQTARKKEERTTRENRRRRNLVELGQMAVFVAIVVHQLATIVPTIHIDGCFLQRRN
jgi:hypothetical protein